MIERIITFSIHYRGLVFAAAIVLALAGTYAVYHTPIDAIPDLSENQVIVFADWPGHGPREIEDEITHPLSQALTGLEGTRVVRGASEFNFSMVSVIFHDRVDVRQARHLVGQQLTAANRRLPPGVVAYLAPESPATGQVFWYTVEGPGYDLGRLRTIQDSYVREQLSAVEGVAEVATVGGMPIEFQVELDPFKLAAHQVTLGTVLKQIAQANAGLGRQSVQKSNLDYLIRGSQGWSASANEANQSGHTQAIVDLENLIISVGKETRLRLADLGRVTLSPGPRPGVLEKDGNEVTGGVVSMRYGENPLALTRRIQDKIDQLQSGLPPGVRIVTVYDRAPLISGAVSTVTNTLIEAIVAASICVLVVLLHVRTTFVIALILPLATLASFLGIWLLRRLGLADIQTNVMSLAGIAVSIGVLVDVAIVMAENAMHTLKLRFGDRPVTGDTREVVLASCRSIGRPIFFSVLIMLLSFLPVFTLEGAEGKMFRPLAATKSLALAGAAVLAITLIPALCTIFIRGRLRNERDSPLVRGIMDVYRPVLDYCLSNPLPLAWFLAATCVLAAAPIGSERLFLSVLFAALLAVGWVARSSLGKISGITSLVVIGMLADTRMSRLERGVMTPLDEQMVMDMPISAPRASIRQATDDLKARDMVLCRFPEVEMVVGKAGRAETPTDPAPMYMIETMVDFRPVEFWPKRKLTATAARAQTAAVLEQLVQRGLISTQLTPTERDALVEKCEAAAQSRFDANLREFAYQRNQEHSRDLAPSLVRGAIGRILETLPSESAEVRSQQVERIAKQTSREMLRRFESEPQRADLKALAELVGRELGLDKERTESRRPSESTGRTIERFVDDAGRWLGREPLSADERLCRDVRKQYAIAWREHVRRLNTELIERAAPLYTRIVLEELLRDAPEVNPDLKRTLQALDEWRWQPPPIIAQSAGSPKTPAPAHHNRVKSSPPPRHKWQPTLDSLVAETSGPFQSRLVLWPIERPQLIGFGGELDQALQMPGWGNVWTMPIQNRVDMLATGVNTPIGVRVLGHDLDEVVRVSDEVAAVLKEVPHAADVGADPIRGKGYLEVHVNRQRAAELNVRTEDVNAVVEAAMGGTVASTSAVGRERYPVRLRYERIYRDGDESLRRLRVPVATAGSASDSKFSTVSLEEIADVRIVEGPAVIKSENGMLRNYVRANVRSGSPADFVQLAQRAVSEQIMLPEGVALEWTGQYQYDERARRTLAWMTPLVVLLIFAILYWTYRDWADAALMLLAVPGAFAGGVLFQWLCGYPFSVTVWVGYIACFGMAASTGIIMLVYLRDSLERAGGIEHVDLAGLRRSVLDGAVQRLRPKLLTEGTTIIGLAPMLWSTGVGAEVIRPMVAPVLGGILVADEVIDLLLPVLFYHVRRWRWRRLHAPSATTPTVSSIKVQMDVVSSSA